MEQRLKIDCLDKSHIICSRGAGVKCRCADVPTCKMWTNIMDIICGCDG